MEESRAEDMIPLILPLQLKSPKAQAHNKQLLPARSSALTPLPTCNPGSGWMFFTSFFPSFVQTFRKLFFQLSQPTPHDRKTVIVFQALL